MPSVPGLSAGLASGAAARTPPSCANGQDDQTASVDILASRAHRRVPRGEALGALMGQHGHGALVVYRP